MRTLPGQLLRRAREAAGLSQTALANRIGTTQSAVARLESERSNPRIETLDRAIAAAGGRLALVVEPASGIDETLIAASLRRSPAERLRSFESAYQGVRQMTAAVRRSRGS